MLTTIYHAYPEVSETLRWVAATLIVSLMAVGMMLTSARIRRWLMKDEEFRLKSQVWCYYHKVYEDAEPCYKSCAQCGHVYPTKQSIAAVDNNLVGEDDQAIPVLTVHACPYCLHDW